MEAKDYVEAILAMDWTQVQIAEETGINQPAISKILRGVVDDVMSKNYRALQRLHERLVAEKATGAALQGAVVDQGAVSGMTADKLLKAVAVTTGPAGGAHA